jgi:hypothetical protein
MTWRAFLIGLGAVALVAAVSPYNDLVAHGTFLTGNHFPAGPFFILILLVVAVNLLIKLVRKCWALKSSELMLVWCMMIVASTVPGSGLMRYWLPMVAAPAYYGARPDKDYEEHILREVPEDLVLSTDVRSVAATRFFEGPKLRVPWKRWVRPIATWSAFILLFYLATFFLTGMLRKHWVEVEHLAFPLARVPLELVEGSDGPGLVPPFFRKRALLVGLALSLAFGLMRIAPVMTGADTGWRPQVPVQSVLWGTPLESLRVWSGHVYPMVIGFAFLVPADVALSVWLFFLLTHMQLVFADWLGTPIEGGDYSPFMQWQQAGAFIVFTIMMFWAARRHLMAVVRKAIGAAPSVDDSEEPIGHRTAFWGLVISVVGMIFWYVWHGMSILTTVPLLMLMACLVLVHARLVAQGGIFFVQQSWHPPTFLHGLTGGIFTAPAVVTAQMQDAILLTDAREVLSGHAFNALKISSVFKRHRRWFMPVMLAAIIVAMVVSGWMIMRIFYTEGAVNTADAFAYRGLPLSTFDGAHQMIDNPAKAVQTRPGGLALGAAIMFFVTFMRMRFYWWPLHSLGFLIGSTWPGQTLWFGFLVGWFTKVMVMKFGGGGMLRTARNFFLGVIVGEALLVGISALFGLAGVRFGNLFLPG